MSRGNRLILWLQLENARAYISALHQDHRSDGRSCLFRLGRVSRFLLYLPTVSCVTTWVLHSAHYSWLLLDSVPSYWDWNIGIWLTILAIAVSGGERMGLRQIAAALGQTGLVMATQRDHGVRIAIVGYGQVSPSVIKILSLLYPAVA